MGFSIDHLIGAYKDFARGYLFYAQVDFPAVAQFAGLGVTGHSYLVSSTQLPPQTIETTPVAWQGMEYKVPTTQTFDNHDITFKSDQGQDLRRAFLNWMAGMHDPFTNTSVLTTGGQNLAYMSLVKLTQLNGNQQPIMTYNLINAFPVTVGEISLDYTSKEVSTFTVSFAYQYHTTDGVGVAPAIPALVP